MIADDIYRHVDEKKLHNYAKLAVQVGVNVRDDQLVVIHSDIRNAVLARLIQAEAYAAGASNVVIDWTDELSVREFYLHARDDAIDHFPRWQSARFREWDDAGAAYIHIISENPDIFKGVSVERMSRFRKASRIELRDHYARRRSYDVRWSLLAVPNVTWAAKVFPQLSETEALESLWQIILQGARADGEDPVEDWREHGRSFDRRIGFLNEAQFRALHFTNSFGTDLWVGLPKRHVFIGGHVLDGEGIPFFPNIPTEEIFTAPHKNEVHGRLVSSKPLIHEGNTIHDVLLTFEGGRIVDYRAGTGSEVLRSIIETDEGSHYLGEIALVAGDSPLSRVGALFFNTLFDENTACHIGIGNASPSNLQGGGSLQPRELEKAGLNSSLVLVNLTFGSSDMRVVGVEDDGTEVLLMQDGQYRFEQ